MTLHVMGVFISREPKWINKFLILFQNLQMCISNSWHIFSFLLFPPSGIRGHLRLNDVFLWDWSLSQLYSINMVYILCFILNLSTFFIIKIRKNRIRYETAWCSSAKQGWHLVQLAGKNLSLYKGPAPSLAWYQCLPWKSVGLKCAAVQRMKVKDCYKVYFLFLETLSCPYCLKLLFLSQIVFFLPHIYTSF